MIIIIGTILNTCYSHVHLCTKDPSYHRILYHIKNSVALSLKKVFFNNKRNITKPFLLYFEILVGKIKKRIGLNSKEKSQRVNKWTENIQVQGLQAFQIDV